MADPLKSGVATRRGALGFGLASLAAAAVGEALTAVSGAWAATPSHEIMGLGWYVVFSRPSLMDQMTAFYEKTIGLPEMLNMRTDVRSKNLLWGGEDIVVDLAHHALETPLSPREADPATARQVPIFRTDDLDALMADFAARGARILPARQTYYGREAFVIDLMGRLIGFRQRDLGSPFASDKEARRRFTRGEAFNPGCAPMPTHLQELGWVRLRVADMNAARAFYGARVGLRDLGTAGGAALFDLGDNTTLEIVGNGVARPAPAEQRASEAVAILRVVNFPATMARLKAAGQPFPYTIANKPNQGFTYISDTEGNLLGLADRKPPAAYKGLMPVAPEDLEAHRRWVEATAGGV
jgi:predicted enzyme related to lactoylglutathione lyase